MSIVGIAAAFGVTLMGAPVAMAHPTSDSLYDCGKGAQERCGYGGVTNSHKRVYSCDTYADGYGFRTYYWLRNGGTGYVDDANGSKSGCSDKTPGTSTNPITYFQVCSKRPNYNICHTARAA